MSIGVPNNKLKEEKMGFSVFLKEAKMKFWAP
jgi:hypothetical protein